MRSLSLSTRAIAATLLVAGIGGCNSCRSAAAPDDEADAGTTASSSGGQGASSSGGTASGSSSSSGGAPGTDGGALEEPLEAFCRGSGTVVVTSGSDSICAGQLAEDTFTFALCACEQLVINAQVTVDAFNSSLGGYGAAVDGGTNVLDDGHLAMNGGPLILDKKLSVLGSAYIGGGDLQLGPESVVQGNLYVFGDLLQGTNTQGLIGRNAFINGDVPARYTIEGNLTAPASATIDGTVNGTTTRAGVPQQLPCPCGADQVLDIAALTAWGATHNDNAVVDAGVTADLWATGSGPDSISLPCGRYYVTNIQHPNVLSITAEGRVALFVDGDFQTGGISIDIGDGAELDLFIKGDLAITSAATFGSASSPSKVRTYVGGNVTLSASSVFAGNIYAPNAEVLFSASTDIYGSLFVRQVTFGANAQVHFDSAIRTAGEACDTPDAGPAPDAGTTTADGGTPDAGGPAPDAGPPACTDRCNNDCGEQACIIPAGQSSGQCGACTSDLDCCAPELCDVSLGVCTLISG